jgi:hypothetical protein
MHLSTFRSVVFTAEIGWFNFRVKWSTEQVERKFACVVVCHNAQTTIQVDPSSFLVVLEG